VTVTPGVVRGLVCALGVFGLVLCADVCTAQEPTAIEPHVKAAFIYNFLKFIEWPAETLAAGPLIVCVTGSPAVADSLKKATTQGRPLDHDVTVLEITADAVPKSCHLIYVGQADEATARRWLALLNGSTAFSVSDCARFARLGGVANFFVEDGRLRFAVNVDAARRASLHISSRMLMLATIVKDEPASRDVRPLR
jgi:hypothetical protein